MYISVNICILFDYLLLLVGSISYVAHHNIMKQYNAKSERRQIKSILYHKFFFRHSHVFQEYYSFSFKTSP